MIRSRIIALRALAAALALLAFLAPAPAATPAAGSADGAWFIALPKLGGAVLVYLDAADPGAGMIVTRFPVSPVALAAGDKSVIVAFASEGAGDAMFRPFRQTSIATDRSGIEVFSRPRALPPLPSGAPLAGLITVDNLIVALTLSPAELWICDVDHWSNHPLPHAAGSADALWLIKAQGRIGICAASASGDATLYTATPTSADAPWDWSTSRIALPPNSRDVLAVSSHIIAAHAADDGDQLHLAIVRPEDWIDRASIPIGAVPPTIAALGDRIIFLTPGDQDPLRAHARVIGLDGSTAFDGSITAASPLSPQDLQFVVFGVMGVVVAAMLFALRADVGTPINLPENAVIAPPLRRFAATLIDLIPGVVAGVTTFSVPLPSAESVDPASVAIGIAFLTILIVAAVSEAVFARTLGKWALGLRTISLTGDKPTWAQALGRTLSKLVFPPIGLLILMHPTVPPPGSCGTIVVMDRPSAHRDPANPPNNP